MAATGLRLQRLLSLGIELPPMVKPVASYTPYVIDKNGLLWISGQIPVVQGKLTMTGLVTDDLISEAQDAAKICAINALSVMEEAVGLDNIDRIIKVSGFVKAAHSFNSPHLVINGCSNFLGQVFDDPHARSAIVVSSLPLDASVEIDFVAQLK